MVAYLRIPYAQTRDVPAAAWTPRSLPGVLGVALTDQQSVAVPLRFGSAGEFARCRELLQQVNYTEDTLRARYRLVALSDIVARQRTRGPIAHPLELLTQLFIDGRYASRSQIEGLLPANSLETFAALGLVAPAVDNAELWAATVMLYPRASLYLASDRPILADGATLDRKDDMVFSALTDNTERFLDQLPSDPCECFLDLGTGTGVAAFVAASYARRVWATDLTERAIHFAEFNRRLNALSNVTVLQGDLYAPVTELSFDCIVIHPPYVPALQRAVIYQDGGLDGQELTQRAVAGLQDRLSPGGRFYCLALGTDRVDLPFEQAIRRWLQPNDADFDIAFIPRHTISPEFMARSVALKSSGAAGAARLEHAFKQLTIREFAYGAIVIQRHAAPRPCFTVRRERAPGREKASVDWLLRWETELASRGSGWLLGARLHVGPDTELLVTHRRVAGELVPAAYRLQTAHPFNMEAKAAPWMGVLVARCDGTITGREHYDYLRQIEAIPEGVGPADFARVLGQLASGGFIWIPGFEPGSTTDR